MDEHEAPYLGLRAYRADDVSLFHGRDDLLAQLHGAVGRHRFVTVVGASGAGKSSLLHAGLLATAEQAGRQTVAITPGSHPIEEISVAVAALSGASVTALREAVASNPTGLHDGVRQVLAAREIEGDLLIVVDQFEELFTLCDDAAERAAFLAALITAATTETSRARIVTGVRADFYTHCCAQPELAQAMNGTHIVVGPMTSGQLRAAVLGPAAAAGLSVESALLAEVTADALGEPGALPLVSHALLQTWRRRRGTVLSLTGYQAAGGIRHALAQTAEAAFDDLSPAQQQTARELFIRLTALGEGTEDTKRRLRRSEFDLPGADLEAVLDKLTSARLIVLDHDTIEIAHEALIRAWPRLRGWLDDNRDSLRLQRRLTDDAGIWDDLNRDPGVLYRGERLASAQEWAQSANGRLTTRERRFLDASRAAEALEHLRQRRRTRQLRWLAASLAMLLIAATTVAVVAVQQRERALTQERIATSRHLAVESRTEAEYDVATAIRKGLDAYHAYPTPEARGAVLSLASKRGYHALLPSPPATTMDLAFSPDGRWLAAAGEPPQLTLWDVPTRRPAITVVVPSGRITAVGFSPDGQRVAAGTTDGHIYIWDVASRMIATTLVAADTNTAIRTVQFGPDGPLLASVDMGNAVILWNTEKPAEPLTLATNHQAPHASFVVSSAAAAVFSPDGGLLAFTDTTGAVALWDVRTGTRAGTLPSLDAWTNSAAFTSDGRVLATTSATTPMIRLWDVATSQHLTDLTGATATHTSVVLDRANARLITTDTQGKVTLWDIEHRKRLNTLDASLWASRSAVSPDGRYIASVISHGIALWDRAELPLIGGTGPLSHVEVSGSDHAVVAGQTDGTTTVWNIDSRTIRASAASPDHGSDDMLKRYPLLSPNGRFVITAGSKGERLVRDANTLAIVSQVPASVDGRSLISASISSDSRILALARVHGGGIWFYDLKEKRYTHRVAEGQDVGNMQYSPDGRMFAYVTDGRVLNVLNANDLSPMATLTVVGSDVSFTKWPTYRFSDDGSRLMVNSPELLSSGKITIWETVAFSKVAEIDTPGAYLNSIHFSPDRRYIASFDSSDDVVIIWDTVTESRWATLSGHSGNITSARWKGNGILASASADQTIILWSTDVDDAIRRLCRSLSHDLSSADPAPAGCSGPP
ncbi:NACHT and WD repeat domain-containing protein [Saccharothrix sp. AJ9571]|nr:NACHT and WD repeat domain-containing protein [Saccharothrix sp. AJ9571]